MSHVSGAAAPEPTSHSSTLVGWREWARLPGLGVPSIKVKVDTGARTSSLHAFDVEEFRRRGRDWVRFSIHPWQRTQEDAVVVERQVLARRRVRSSSGHTQVRLVVPMRVRLAGRTVRAEVTLSRRDEMGFRMLIGREALRQGFVVDSARSYLGGRPRRSTRRRNRGL